MNRHTQVRSSTYIKRNCLKGNTQSDASPWTGSATGISVARRYSRISCFNAILVAVVVLDAKLHAPIDLEIHRSRLVCAPTTSLSRRRFADCVENLKSGTQRGFEDYFPLTLKLAWFRFDPESARAGHRDTCSMCTRVALLAMPGEGIKRVSSTRKDFRPLGWLRSLSSLTGHHSSHRSNFTDSRLP